MSIHHLTNSEEKVKLPVYVSELHKESDTAEFDTDLVTARLSSASNLGSITGLSFSYSTTYTANDYKVTDYYGQFSAVTVASQQFFSINLEALSVDEQILYAYVHMDRLDSNDEYQGRATIFSSEVFQLNIDTNALLASSSVVFSYHLKTIKPLSI
jgi:hypothetical protein